MNNIPKVIHYCWFGHGELPSMAQKCIDSWKEKMPEYEIKRWDESNYNINKNNYVKEAYDSGKYAFVSDYARFDILYNFGGIYFDVDVEVIQSLEPLLERGSFMGFEAPGRVATGLGLATYKGNSIYEEILKSYEDNHFIVNGKQDLTTVVERVTTILKKYNLEEIDSIQSIKDITIYPTEFFCPIDIYTMKLNISDKTYTIHHYFGSWCTESEKKLIRRKIYISSKINNSFLAFIFQKICVLLKLLNI